MSDQVKNGIKTPEVYRASKSAYVVFALILGGPLLFALPVFFRRPLSSWKVFVLQLTALLFSYCWLWFFRLVLSKEDIHYRTLFKGTVGLAWKEISKAETIIGYGKGGLWNALKPPFRLVLEPEPSLNKRAIVINLKVFNKRDLARLFEILDTKLDIAKRPRDAKIFTKLGLGAS
jgi:hypothetical protein